jgi:hypothetical protein
MNLQAHLLFSQDLDQLKKIKYLQANPPRQTVRMDKLQAKKNNQDLTRTVRTYKTCSAARFYFLLKTQFRLTESREKYGISAEKWTGPILAKWINNDYGPEYQKAQVYNLLDKIGIAFEKSRD